MSRPESYAGVTYSSTTSFPSSSTIGTAQHQHHRRRTSSESDEDALETGPFTTLTALVGDSDSDVDHSDGDGEGGSGGRGGGNNRISMNNSDNNTNGHTYTYNRNRGNLRSEHHQTLAYEERHHPDADGVPFITNHNNNFNDNTNHNNHTKFHYHQRGRQPSTTHGLAWDQVDDDIDGDEEDEWEEEEEYEEEDDGYRNYGASMRQQRRSDIDMENSDVDVDVDLALDPDLEDDDPSQSRAPSHISQSWTKNRSIGIGKNENGGIDGIGIHETVPSSRFAEPTTTTSTSTTSNSGSSSGGGGGNRGTSYHPTPAYTRFHQSQHQHRQSQQYQSQQYQSQQYQSQQYQYQQHQQHHHQYHPHQSGASASASVSNPIYSSNNTHTHDHDYDLRRQQQRQQQQQQEPPQPPQPPPQQNRHHHPHRLPLLPPLPAPSLPPPPPPPSRPPPRAASSLAIHSAAYLNSSTSRTRSSSRRSSPPPPRISSLLPRSRSNATTDRNTIAAAVPIFDTVVDRSQPASATTAATSAATNPPIASLSSNATVQRVPTQPQFAVPFLDPLNPTTATGDTQADTITNTNPDTNPDTSTEAVWESGIGSSGLVGPGPGPGPGPHPRVPPSHSRTNSFGTAGGSLRNLNRWSSSTASSRFSTWDYHQQQQQQQQQKHATSFARRMSVDSIGVLPQHPELTQRSLPPTTSSPRKLSKQRPSRATGASPVTRARAPARARAASTSTTSDLATGNAAAASPLRYPSSSPVSPPSRHSPPPNLPPIISLPPLDTDPESRLRPGSPRAMSRASPGLNTPNSVFASQHGNAEPQDYFWSDLSNPTRTASPAMRTNTGLLPPAPVTRDRDATLDGRAHSRSRSAARGGGDSVKPKDRSSSKPSQKAMLSKALNKANTAVQLDNAQNYGAAREAYLEACELLQQVLARTNGDDDRKKLEAIRRTYTSRIEELDELVPVNPHGDKALPARPDSFEYHQVRMGLAGMNDQSDATAVTRPRRDESPDAQISSRTMPGPAGFTTYRDFSSHADGNRSRQTSYSRSPMRRNFEGGALTVPRHANDHFLPAPLSPRRPLSPTRAPSPEPIVRHDFSLTSERERPAAGSEYRSHRRNLSHESASWLDPIDESGGSTSSSVHSRSSSRVTRKHIRQPSGDTEAEFDAALDAAVEAAYDDGYEPLEPPMTTYDDDIDEDEIVTSMRGGERAEELVRQTEREAAMEMARQRERQRQASLSHQSESYGGDFFDANDSDEEEERMLEEMTRGYAMEDFTLNQQHRSQTSVPRESNSSGLTSRTWHSSMGSNPPTGATAFSAGGDILSSGHIHKASSPLPPPTQSLPQPPPNRPPSSTGVRSRRLSGQATKKLKIETSKLGPPPAIPPPPVTASSAVPPQPTSSYIVQQRQAMSAVSTRPGPFSSRAPSPPVRGMSHAEGTNPASPPVGQDDEARPDSPPSARPDMRKNFSSSSLKSLRSRQVSMPHIDDVDPLPMTPLTQQVSNSSVTRLPMMPALPTPIATTFGDKTAGGFSGIHLFDSDFHSPVTQSPNLTHHDRQANLDLPLPLEPCPSDPMFRPFWLMRALYQTLAHPRGGYISNRLFVPQDAWKVKGVKLRNIEDKVSQCDLLTAALLKLARVDSNDADAVLDEMQSFETILETVQATLSRRLGTEVGTQGMVTLKEEKETEVPPVPRNNSISGKGGAFSWRRLRSKGSAVNLASTYGVKTNSNGGGASTVPGILESDVVSPGGTMPSLPMVAHPSSRPAKRDVSLAKFEGPNANYMASLARLFDAAQTVDQIARQVDDPGLRHADKTQVGLELCTRHAAEFFGFYICRFVLTDLSMLLDKFVKRGSEWVLS